MQTTILGTTYSGRPMFGSFASKVKRVEELEGPAAARRLIAAHATALPCYCKDNRTAMAWEDSPPRCNPDGSHPFEADMTTAPMEGVITCPAMTGGRRDAHL